MINKIGATIVALLIMWMVVYKIQEASPCSAWAAEPQLCTSDNIE